MPNNKFENEEPWSLSKQINKNLESNEGSEKYSPLVFVAIVFVLCLATCHR